jgi:hypothetical protein
MRIDMRYLLRWFGGYLLASFFVVLLILIMGFIPKTTTGWLITFVFGLPSWILCEWIGNKVTCKRISKAIDPSEKQVSSARLFYLLMGGSRLEPPAI